MKWLRLSAFEQTIYPRESPLHVDFGGSQVAKRSWAEVVPKKIACADKHIVTAEYWRLQRLGGGFVIIVELRKHSFQRFVAVTARDYTTLSTWIYFKASLLDAGEKTAEVFVFARHSKPKLQRGMINYTQCSIQMFIVSIPIVSLNRRLWILVCVFVDFCLNCGKKIAFDLTSALKTPPPRPNTAFEFKYLVDRMMQCCPLIVTNRQEKEGIFKISKASMAGVRVVELHCPGFRLC